MARILDFEYDSSNYVKIIVILLNISAHRIRINWLFGSKEWVLTYVIWAYAGNDCSFWNIDRIHSFITEN